MRLPIYSPTAALESHGNSGNAQYEVPAGRIDTQIQGAKPDKFSIRRETQGRLR